jgi:hypothetical protein
MPWKSVSDILKFIDSFGCLYVSHEQTLTEETLRCILFK